MCTVIFPIGSCVGCGMAFCCGGTSASSSSGSGSENCRNDSIPIMVDDNNNNKAAERLRQFAAVLAAGCFCYLVLTIVCAKADGDPWTLIRVDGECWSEGGDMPYIELGLMTGALLGVGLFGTLILACQVRRRRQQQSSAGHGGGTTTTQNYSDRQEVEML
jgi:hypothetical protein